MMKTRKEESVMLKSVIRPVLIGVLIGAVCCLAVLLVLSIAAASIDIPPAAVVPLATVGAAVGAFVGGFVSAKVARRNGWIIGAVSAFFLFVMSMLAGLGLFSQMNMGFVGIKLLVMLACGMVGGIFAVNSGNKKR